MGEYRSSSNKAPNRERMKKMTDQQIAQTALTQLGGNKFIAMTGAKNIGFDKGGKLTFKIGRNAASINFVTVIYNAGVDLYSMSFERISQSKKTFEVKRKLVKSYDGLFGDQLQKMFTDATGMYTSL